ncbi:enoyl-CoA hydratase-related protein [Maricurvus nonylphenolicus]|uniref:enoyl-CoA hydratase/isomerase family protein n=1 Tax=Maricurvus nonylphenolicus TaxID=1008307 RepID=UPI0036F285B4
MSLATYSFENGIATIVINNPPQNRLSKDLMFEFAGMLEQLKNTQGLRGVFLRSEGPDFSFGGDITPWLDREDEQTRQESDAAIMICNAFEDLPVPVVVAIQGRCAGGGLEMALRADVLVAAEDASFSHPEKTIGVFTLLGGVQRVADRVGRTRAMKWALTAEAVSAQEALDAGLITQLVPQAELLSACDEWLAQLSTGPTLAHTAHKKLLRAWSNGGVKAADNLMTDMAVDIFKSEDARNAIEGAIKAFLAGEERPTFEFNGK